MWAFASSENNWQLVHTTRFVALLSDKDTDGQPPREKKSFLHQYKPVDSQKRVLDMNASFHCSP